LGNLKVVFVKIPMLAGNPKEANSVIMTARFLKTKINNLWLQQIIKLVNVF